MVFLRNGFVTFTEFKNFSPVSILDEFENTFLNKDLSHSLHLQGFPYDFQLSSNSAFPYKELTTFIPFVTFLSCMNSLMNYEMGFPG